MDPLQERLAHIALHVIGDRGFVLGGGHAIELHRMGTRPSEGIDLFSADRGSPGEVADDVLDAYRDEGFAVTVRLRTADLVQLQVTDSQARSCMVDLGVFWRARSPVLLDIGPVLHPDDAVAGKMDALFNRWAPRDFLDVDAILASGRYTQEQLSHGHTCSASRTGSSPRTEQAKRRSPGCEDDSLPGKRNCKPDTEPSLRPPPRTPGGRSGYSPGCLPVSVPGQSPGAKRLEVEPEDRWLLG